MIGKLQHRIEIQEVYTEYGYGEGRPSGAKTIRCEMFFLKPISGTEYEEADQLQSSTRFDARCHFFRGANSRLQLRYGGRIFHVESVTNWLERNRFLDWKLVEVAQVEDQESEQY